MFSFLPKPIYHVITDLHLGGALVILIAALFVWLFIQAVYGLRFLHKRWRLLCIVHRDKGRIFVANPLWFFGFHKDKPDFYILNGEKTFSVKVIGAFHPGVEFRFSDGEHYRKQRHICLGSQLVMIACGYGKAKTLAPIDFAFQCENFGIEKERVIPTFLFCPAAYQITAGGATPHGRLADFGTRFGYGISFHVGDTLFDHHIMDTSTLKNLSKYSSAL